MNTCIVLLRGINVGGKNNLPMAELVFLLESLGAQDVRTYIQSGNAVLRGTEKVQKKIQRELAGEISRQKGFDTHVLVIDADQYNNIMAANPFAHMPDAGAILHVGFLAEAPANPDRARLEKLKIPSEQFHLTDHAFYLHAPEGFGKSKLAAGAEKAIGAPMTVRNWKTVCKLQEMLHQDQ